MASGTGSLVYASTDLLGTAHEVPPHEQRQEQLDEKDDTGSIDGVGPRVAGSLGGGMGHGSRVGQGDGFENGRNGDPEARGAVGGAGKRREVEAEPECEPPHDSASLPEAPGGVPSLGTVTSSDTTGGVHSFGTDATASELAYPSVPAPPALQEGVCSFRTEVTASELDYPAPYAPTAAEDSPLLAPPAGQTAASTGPAQPTLAGKAAASAGATQHGGSDDAEGAPAGSCGPSGSAWSPGEAGGGRCSWETPWGQLPVGTSMAPLLMGYPIPVAAPLYLAPMGGVPPEMDMGQARLMVTFALQQAEAWRTVAEASKAWKHASQGYPEGEGATTAGASTHSPVMHHGQRQDFPAPTKQIRRPRLRNLNSKQVRFST